MSILVVCYVSLFFQSLLGSIPSSKFRFFPYKQTIWQFRSLEHLEGKIIIVIFRYYWNCMINFFNLFLLIKISSVIFIYFTSCFHWSFFSLSLQACNTSLGTLKIGSSNSFYCDGVFWSNCICRVSRSLLFTSLSPSSAPPNEARPKKKSIRKHSRNESWKKIEK